MKKKWISLFLLTALLLSFTAACKKEKIKTPEPPKTTTPPISGTEVREKPVEETTEITAAEAEDVALNHAGLTREKVQRLYTEKDYDDGVSVYDVQFVYEKQEYEYEIHANSGKILSFDKDYD